MVIVYLPIAVAKGAKRSATSKRSTPTSSGPGIHICVKSPNKFPITSCPPILANLSKKKYKFNGFFGVYISKKIFCSYTY